MQISENDFKIGEGINQGYTSLLTERYFGNGENISNFHQYEKSVAEKLEIIIGQEKMENLYFTANLYGLIGELAKYEREEEILNFIQKVDFINEYLNSKKLISAFKKEIIERRLLKK